METITSSFQTLKRLLNDLYSKILNDKDTLPLLKSNKNNGVQLNIVNRSVLISLVWLLSSLFVIYYGFRDCRYNSYHYSLKCNSNDCTYTSSSNKGQSDIKIDRINLMRVDTVRIDSYGNITEYGEGSRKTSKKIGYSVQISFKHIPEPNSRFKLDKDLLFAPIDMGRRSSRSISSKIFTYIDKTSNKIDVGHSKTITIFGLLCIILGLLSSFLSCALGIWSDPEPRRVKKSS